LYKVNF